MDCLAPVHYDPCRLQAVVPCIERAAWARSSSPPSSPRAAPPTARRHSTGDQGGARGCRGPGGAEPPAPCRPPRRRPAPSPTKTKKAGRRRILPAGPPPKAAPHCLPACASGAGSRLWRNMVCAVRPSPQKDARQGAMAKIQSVPVPARKDRHGTGPNPRHRAAAAGAGTGRPSGRPPRPGPWR